jgi:hypothetical protein
MVPSRACSGVRATPVPVVPGAEVIDLTILLSNRDGCPYGWNASPGSRIQVSTLSGTAWAEAA